MLSGWRQLVTLEFRNVLTVDNHRAGICLEKPTNQFEGDTLAGAAPPQQDEGGTRGHREGNILQHGTRTERFGDRIEPNRALAVLLAHLRIVAHEPPPGYRKKMHFTRMTLHTMRKMEERTTLCVEARPTPSAPPVAL